MLIAPDACKLLRRDNFLTEEYYHGVLSCIVSCSYRIGPTEVEVVLMDHPAVLDAAVVGSPDGLRGEVSKLRRISQLLQKKQSVIHVSVRLK